MNVRFIYDPKNAEARARAHGMAVERLLLSSPSPRATRGGGIASISHFSFAAGLCAPFPFGEIVPSVPHLPKRSLCPLSSSSSRFTCTKSSARVSYLSSRVSHSLPAPATAAHPPPPHDSLPPRAPGGAHRGTTMPGRFVDETTITRYSVSRRYGSEFFANGIRYVVRRGRGGEGAVYTAH